MKINILTLFPQYFTETLQASILGKAVERRAIEYNIVDIRDFADDKHQVTDDTPYGGGAGMVMKIKPIDLALQSLAVEKGQEEKKIILTSAKGELFDQKLAADYSKLKELTIICGHYEGVDERVAENLVDEEVRIGDYVLTGGEPAALVMTDAVVRLIPGVLGNEQSLQDESHSSAGVLSYPVYTKPEVYKGWAVPPVLLSGHHQKIKEWRSRKKKKL